ncbi:MAG: 30S ribosomal protein S2 [Ignavibacteriae bacterium]|nr:MAG: 30S ribosomal protein S2 [Ignavibacteriota bacterium]
MIQVSIEDLLLSGAHFGHLTRRWNPKMKRYIFMERNGIHIIDLKKTHELLMQAAESIGNLVTDGRNILFIGTKKQAKEVVKNEALRSGMNFVTERWLGGMLTNFSTIRKSIKRLNSIIKMETDGTFENIQKKERLVLSREKEKLEKILGGISTMNKLPGAIFLIDVKKEHIAVDEARKLNIPIFAIVDTNCDPDLIDYPVPANDDAVKSIELITRVIADAIIDARQRSEMKRLHADEEVDAGKVTETRKKGPEITPPDTTAAEGAGIS